MLKEQKLTEKELRGYRQWLSELDVESREEQESSRQTVDPDIWRVFNPEGNIGRQMSGSTVCLELSCSSRLSTSSSESHWRYPRSSFSVSFI